MSTERMKKHNKAVGIEPYKSNRSKPKEQPWKIKVEAASEEGRW